MAARCAHRTHRTHRDRLGSARRACRRRRTRRRSRSRSSTSARSSASTRSSIGGLLLLELLERLLVVVKLPHSLSAASSRGDDGRLPAAGAVTRRRGDAAPILTCRAAPSLGDDGRLPSTLDSLRHLQRRSRDARARRRRARGAAPPRARLRVLRRVDRVLVRPAHPPRARNAVVAALPARRGERDGDRRHLPDAGAWRARAASRPPRRDRRRVATTRRSTSLRALARQDLLPLCRDRAPPPSTTARSLVPVASRRLTTSTQRQHPSATPADRRVTPSPTRRRHRQRQPRVRSFVRSSPCDERPPVRCSARLSHS